MVENVREDAEELATPCEDDADGFATCEDAEELAADGPGGESERW
jgi:hypothetical protein